MPKKVTSKTYNGPLGNFNCNTQKELSSKSNFQDCLKKYFDSTTLHGLKYLTMTHRPIHERIYWLVAVLMVYLLMMLIIYDHISLFAQNPVLISHESNPTPVSKIPFPAVTICPHNQLRKSVFNFTEAMHNKENNSEDKRILMDYIVLMCYKKNKRRLLTDPVNIYDPKFVHKMMTTLNGMESCEKMIKHIKWLSSLVTEKCEYLQPTITMVGACLSLNMLPAEKIYRYPNSVYNNEKRNFGRNYTGFWNPDDGYPKNNSSRTFPWKTSQKGIGNSASILMKLENDLDESCNDGGRGFIVYIHNPGEPPRESHSLFYTDVNKMYYVYVVPKLYKTNEKLRPWKPEHRGCYYQSERELTFFHIYTQQNCDLECLANRTLKRCGCAQTFHPRLPDTPICASGKEKCAQESEVEQTETESDTVCHCLPSCFEIEYDIEVLKVSRKLDFNVSDGVNKTDSENNSLISVMFKKKYSIAIKRDIKFEYSDFIGNIGGILGLFLGFSLLSLIELFYFLFCRPCHRLRKKRVSRRLENQVLFHHSNFFPGH